MTTPPLSRGQTLRQSLSDHARASLPSFARSSTMLFNTRKETWAEAEKSVGRPCECKFKGIECWEVTGPALDVFNKIAPDIDKLLVDNQELLEQGEPKPRVVAFHMWMAGSKPSSAQPVLVFSSKSRRQRLYAKTLLEQSGLLKPYAGISVKTLDKMPAVHQAAVMHWDVPLLSQSGPDVFMTDPSSEPFGAQISFGDSKIATMLGLVTLNGKRHALIPQHPRFDYHDDDLESLPTKDQVLEFDEDSDADDSDLVEITSAASVTPSPSETDDTSFQQSDEDSIFEAAYTMSSTPATSPPSSSRTSIRGSVAFSEAEWAALHAPRQEQCQRVKVATLPTDDNVNDLDYECLPVDDAKYQKPNRILLPTNADESPQFLFPRAVASSVEESPVWAVTGTTGLVKGTIIRNPYYIRMNGSHTCQEMWPVRLDRDTMPGDCGAWVVNADTGDIYGHIVAGDPVSGMAYIIPAHKVFADIERRHGARPSLWTGEVDVQLTNTDSITLSEQMPSLPPLSDLSDLSDRKDMSGVTDSAALALIVNQIIGTGIFTHSSCVLRVKQNWPLPESLKIYLHLYVAATIAMALTCHSAGESLSFDAASLLLYRASCLGVLLPELNLGLRQPVTMRAADRLNSAEAIRKSKKKGFLRELERGIILAKSYDSPIKACHLSNREHTFLWMKSDSSMTKIILLTLLSSLDCRILDALSGAMGPYVFPIGHGLILADLSSQSRVSALLVRGQSWLHDCWQSATRGPNTIFIEGSASVNWSSLGWPTDLISRTPCTRPPYTRTRSTIQPHMTPSRMRKAQISKCEWCTCQKTTLAIPRCSNPFKSLQSRRCHSFYYNEHSISSEGPSRRAEIRREAFAFLVHRTGRTLTRTSHHKGKRSRVTMLDLLTSPIALSEQQSSNPPSRNNKSMVMPTALTQKCPRCRTKLLFRRHEDTKPADILMAKEIFENFQWIADALSVTHDLDSVTPRRHEDIKPTNILVVEGRVDKNLQRTATALSIIGFQTPLNIDVPASPRGIAEKSFNRADVFRRHLTSVHGLQQPSRNSCKNCTSIPLANKSSTVSLDAVGKCSSCSALFHNAQDFYEILGELLSPRRPKVHVNQDPISSSFWQVLRTPYVASHYHKIMSPECKDILWAVRGAHELRRHLAQYHDKYSAYYNAAAHLRRVHFNRRDNGCGKPSARDKAWRDREERSGSVPQQFQDHARRGREAHKEVFYQRQPPEKLESEFEIWEVARATSAVKRLYHEPSRQVYLDNAIYHNNPTQIADFDVSFKEASRTNPRSRHLLHASYTAMDEAEFIGRRNNLTRSWSERKQGETDRFVDELQAFDHRFFNMTPRGTSSIDQWSRHLLEAVYESLEKAESTPRRHILTPHRGAQRGAYHVFEQSHGLLIYHTTRETSQDSELSDFGRDSMLFLAPYSNATSLVVYIRTRTRPDASMLIRMLAFDSVGVFMQRIRLDTIIEDDDTITRDEWSCHRTEEPDANRGAPS